MATILSEYFPKTYIPINELESKNIWGSNDSFIDNTLSDGYIHSIYTRLEKSEYLKMFQKYKSTNIERQKFILYGNNLLFLLILRKNSVLDKKEEIWYDTWIKPHETINKEQVVNVKTYTFDDDPIAYTIEPFNKRIIRNKAPFLDVDIRYIANGSWLDVDTQNRIFLGISFNPPNPNKLAIKTNERKTGSLEVDSEAVGAYSTVIDDLRKQKEYFFLNHCRSKLPTLYTSFDDVKTVLRERFITFEY
ncbi:KN57gp_097 [Dikerogammarus haemobaphes nudivirus]|nr:KN57gp_097 [Dikerogammarus haemobaphes nudivirus]